MKKNPTASHPLSQARALEAQILQLAKQGKMKEAIAHSQQLNKRFPEFASGWYTSSQLAAKLRNPAMALRAIENAVRLDDTEPKWQLQKATCLMQMGRSDSARPIITALGKATLKSAYQCSALGLLLSRLDMNEQALNHYQRAIKLEPELGEHHYNVATVYRFLGNFDAAEKALNRAIAINPRDFEAHKLRSDLRRQTPESNHVTALKQDLDRNAANPNARIQLNYSLAKELEDLQDWEQSFSHLQEGANARREQMRYDIQGDLDTLAKISEVYSASLFSGNISGSDNSEAIFILGMPRTGSTLVERVLGSHSQVYAAGELNNFALEMTKAARKHVADDAGRPSRTQLVELSAKISFAELGSGYIDSTRPATNQAEHFIDKMPLNFLYTGLIHLALPKAKIIHLKRHPLDACYAIYKNLFKDAYPFSYELVELARYYAAYDRLMAHWHSLMPGSIYDIHYESVVADLEGESRKLLEYCNLEWEEDCLRFYENRSASTTASASQVRQPIYNSSVGKWRHFGEQLQPLIDTLQEEGVELQLS